MHKSSGLRRLLLLLLILTLGLQICPIAVQAEETPVQLASQADLAAIIEPQIRAFADSIDQSSAEKNAATALAKHGMTGKGKTLSVGASHALTATIINSEVGQEFLIHACAVEIDIMQKTREKSLFVDGGCGWYSSGYSYSIIPYKSDTVKASEQLKGVITMKNIAGNVYDSSMIWMGGGVDTEVSMKRKTVTADAITYDVSFRAYDRFDFNTSNGGGFQDLISGLGTLLFREFDWESKVTFEIVVPNTCTHSTQNYHWTMNPETWDIESDTANGYMKNRALRYDRESSDGSIRRYYELERTVILSHDQHWEMELTVTNPKNILLGTLGNGYDEYPGLMLRGRTFFCARQCERADGDDATVQVSTHSYGTALRPNFSFVSDYPYKLCLENRVEDDGSNMIYLTVYNHAGGVSLQTVALDTYYFSNNEGVVYEQRETVSKGVCGMDFLINCFGNITNQLSGEPLQFFATTFDLKIWEAGKDNSGNYFTSEVTAPTCTEAGYTIRTCTSCGYSTREDIAPLGHTPGEAVRENETAAGYDAVVRCAACGEELSREHVKIIVPGDINGDGNTNNKDVACLFQYLSGWNVEVVKESLDVNRDGAVNNKDVAHLFQYLSGWDVEIS